RSPPTNVTSAPSARSASATASAGTTCPAVPPAAIRIRGPAAVTAFAPASAAPAAAAVDDLEPPRPRTRDVEQQPDRDEHHGQVRRRVGDERQGDAGQRRQPEHDEDVEGPLAQDQ